MTQCLSRLHVFRPRSSAQVATTLMHLPEYHSTHPSLHLEEIGLLAVDSLSAFYWSDRLLAEQLRSVDKSVSAGLTEPVSPMRQITIALQRVRALRGPLTVLANWGLNPSKESAHTGEPYPLYKQHLHPFPSPFDDTTIIASPSRPRGSTTHLQSSSGSAPSNLAQSVRTSESSMSLRARQEFASTHHITLSPRPAVPCTSLLDPSATEEGAVFGANIMQNGILEGFLRTPGGSPSTHFAFRITEDGLVFESSEEL